jgi:Phage integrase family
VTTSFDVHIWALEVRRTKVTGYRVRWRVAGRKFGETFSARQLADSFRSSLVTAASNGKAFGCETGLPESMMRKLTDVSFYEHCAEFAAAVWPTVSAKSRIGLIETLTRAVPVVVSDLAGRPEEGLLRASLRKDLNQGPHAGELDSDEARALAWLKRASRPISSLEDSSVVADVLDALAAKLDGKPASPEYFSRRRRVLHKTLAYAVRKKRLSKNPLAKDNLPEGCTPPEKPDGTVDPRSIGGPALVTAMLDACGRVGVRQGPRFKAFYGCMFHALMRPSEVAALVISGCDLPEEGWGRLSFADASPSAGRAYTDDGAVHEDRGLKGRTKGRPSPRARRPVRSVPIPPVLVTMLRAHVAQFGVGQDGRVFRSEQGNRINASTWWRVWDKVRRASLTEEQLATPLMRRPYDLRHAGVVWRLNSGVPPAEVASWAGHSVEMLTRVYVHCVTGMEDVWISRMDQALNREGR